MSNNELTAVACTGVGRIEVMKAPIEKPGPGEYLVRSEFTAISPGTELRCIAGKQPGAVPFPFIPGYAIAGVIEEAGPGTKLAEGTRVLCDGTRRGKIQAMWGGHVSHAISPEGGVLPAPESVPAEQVVFAKLAAISHRGVHVARPTPGERVVVIGLGLIGLLSARLFAAEGCRVLALDKLESRVRSARSETIVARTIAGTAAEEVCREWPDGPDIVIDATGNPSALAASMECCPIPAWGESEQSGSRLIIQGSYAGEFTLPYQETFLRELSIHLPRDTRPADKREVLLDIAEGRLDVSDLTERRFAPDQAPEAYERLRNGDIQTALIDWRGV